MSEDAKYLGLLKDLEENASYEKVRSYAAEYHNELEKAVKKQKRKG